VKTALRWALPLLAVPIVGLLAYGLTLPDRFTLPSALIELPAPEFRLEDMYDPADSVSLRQYRGRVVVLNFWASWCGPCVAEHPYLVDLFDRYDPEEVLLLGILYEDVPEKGRAFMRQYGGGWPSVVDYRSRTAIPYGVYGVPETFVVTREGTIAYKLVGPLTPGTLPVVYATIDSLLATGSSRTSEPLETAPPAADTAGATDG